MSKNKIKLQQVEINKTPVLCTSHEELREGDILIFSDRGKIINKGAKRRFDIGAFMARKVQGKMNEEGGHKESVHAGVIVRDEHGDLKLAHLIGSGFYLDDIDPSQPNYSRYFSRTTHIYRPRKMQEELAKPISAMARSLMQDDAHKHKGIKWKFLVVFWSAISRMFTSLKLKYTNPDETHFPHDLVRTVHQIAGSSICTRFVADAVINACHNLSEDYQSQTGNVGDESPRKRNFRMRYMNNSAMPMPKSLQAYLWRNRNYDYLIMPERKYISKEKPEAQNRDLHAEFCQDFIAVVRAEADRIGRIIHPKTLQKAMDMRRIISEFEHRTYVRKEVLPPVPEGYERIVMPGANKPQVDAIAECIDTMKQLLPILNTNTKGHSFKTTSYRNIMAYLREQGVYKEYIEHDFYDRRDGKISELAEQHYNYTKPQAKYYSRYRGLGYSDSEAKFEVNPKAQFGDWYKLSPVRNILLTVTGIGFFAWVLPRGLSRAAEVRKNCKVRDQKFAEQDAFIPGSTSVRL